MKIQTNPSGTRSIEITEQHLETIDRYALLTNLTDSNGLVEESVLDKLKLNVRSLLEGEAGKDRQLLDLCLDVIYNSNMKAFGLNKLLMLYLKWRTDRQASAQPSEEEASTEETPEEEA